jgi:hypothetical protein
MISDHEKDPGGGTTPDRESKLLDPSGNIFELLASENHWEGEQTSRHT